MPNQVARPLSVRVVILPRKQHQIGTVPIRSLFQESNFEGFPQYTFYYRQSRLDSCCHELDLPGIVPLFRSN